MNYKNNNGMKWNKMKYFKDISGNTRFDSQRNNVWPMCMPLRTNRISRTHLVNQKPVRKKKYEIDFISYYRFILNSLISSQPIKIIFLIRHINLMLKIGRKKNQIKSLLIFNISDLYSKYLTHLIVLFSFYLFFIN
jgi:hypothetical protein